MNVCAFSGYSVILREMIVMQTKSVNYSSRIILLDMVACAGMDT